MYTVVHCGEQGTIYAITLHLSMIHRKPNLTLPSCESNELLEIRTPVV